jgi:formate dehydrogenase subunit gamma
MFRTISVIAFLATVAGIGLYHAILRSRHIVHVKEGRGVHRFSLFERCLHAAAMLSLTALAFTGFVSIIIFGSHLRGWLWLVHYATGPVFAVAIALIALVWAEDVHFEYHDWKWISYLGGYLWKMEELPAGRFNAGQKAYLWSVSLLSILVVVSGVGRMFPVLGPEGQEIILEAHRYSGLILVLAVIGHLYLGTLANPGTLWAMISGYVGSHWAKHHHPLWWERIHKGGKGDYDK